MRSPGDNTSAYIRFIIVVLFAGILIFMEKELIDFKLKQHTIQSKQSILLNFIRKIQVHQQILLDLIELNSQTIQDTMNMIPIIVKDVPITKDVVNPSKKGIHHGKTK